MQIKKISNSLSRGGGALKHLKTSCIRVETITYIGQETVNRARKYLRQFMNL